MQLQYSLKKRLIIYISIFSIALGCLLDFSAYRISLEEIDEILDAQMQNLAERVATHDPEPIKSHFDQAKHYHEEDFKFNEKVAKVTEVFRVKVLDMTGKRRDNIHPEEKVKRHISLD